MKVITSVCSLIKTIEANKKIYLSSDLYDWLLCSKWNCVLSDKLKEYMKNNEVVRVQNEIS